MTEGQRLRLSMLGLCELSGIFPRDIEVTYLRTMSTIPYMLEVRHDNGMKQFVHALYWMEIPEPMERQVQPEERA